MLEKGRDTDTTTRDVLLMWRRLPSKAARRRRSSGEPRGGELGLGLVLSVSRVAAPRVRRPAREGGKVGGAAMATPAEDGRRTMVVV